MGYIDETQHSNTLSSFSFLTHSFCWHAVDIRFRGQSVLTESCTTMLLITAATLRLFVWWLIVLMMVMVMMTMSVTMTRWA